MNELLFGVACATAVAWVPIFMHFFRSWQSRRNPLSLSICILIGFPIYACMFIYWLLYHVVPVPYTAAVMVGSNTLICVLFHISLHRSQKRFADTRSK